MKINALVAAGMGSLIMASSASAVFTGLFTEEKGTLSVLTGFWCTNVYARFDNPTDRALSVTGASLSPLGGGAQSIRTPSAARPSRTRSCFHSSPICNGTRSSPSA